MVCPYCRSLQLDVDTYIHQKECEDYPNAGPDKDADEMRLRLNGVELGMWADTVLTIHPQGNMVRDPETIKVENNKGIPNYTVKWIYPGFTLTFERAERHHQIYGLLSVYAVQKIEANNERKEIKKLTKRSSRPKIRRSGSRHKRSSTN